MAAVLLADPWDDWRKQVVAVIREDFHELLDDISDADVDWDSWRPLYEAGRSPKAAVDSAFVRDSA
jgi:hypothetical protein